MENNKLREQDRSSRLIAGNLVHWLPSDLNKSPASQSSTLRLQFSSAYSNETKNKIIHSTS